MDETTGRGMSPFAGGILARVRPGPDGGVLWVHGYTVDCTIWSDLWTRLPSWTHCGIDLPGHGASASLPPGATLATLGRELAEAAHARGIRHVVGLSLGSMVALQVVLSRPRAFATLTLAAPALAGGPVEKAVGLRYRELTELYLRRGPGPWMTELWMRSPPATFAHASAALRSRLAATIDRHGWSELADPRRGVAAVAREIQDPRALAESTARVLLVIGEHELPAFRRTAMLLLGACPDATFTVLPSAGHLCMLDAPRDAAGLLRAHWAG